MLISFYGDDFTGSTDVMESLTANGVPAALFLDPPDGSEVDAFRLINRTAAPDGRIQAFGVPGVARSLDPEEMTRTLVPIFAKLSRIPTRYFHYKTCSTFDSSPAVGNIAHATDLALQAFPSAFVPLLVGAPGLGRYCVFGNLFARVGANTYRLDRHPTMSRHPVTPMRESDLRRHLAEQGPRRTELFDLFQLRSGRDPAREAFQKLDRSDCPYVLFDALEDGDLLRVGELIYESAQETGQLLVGSSGVEYALCYYMRSSGMIPPPPDFSGVGAVDQIIALSGSAAPSTAAQIQHALDLGFADIRLETIPLLEERTRVAEIDRVVQRALKALNEGRSPLIYAARGPDDPAIAACKNAVREAGDSRRPGPIIAHAQGVLLRRLLEQAGKQRVVVAGGDTSGYAAQALGLHALEMLLPIAPGAPLCIAHSREEAFHGLEISLKGGQNGNARYFESILRGEALEM